MGVIRQIYSTFIVSCLCLNIGFIFAWPSSTIDLFSSTNTTLNRPMTETEVSLFVSLSSFTALISTPMSGFLLDILGRKRCCILFGLPSVIAWSIASLVPRVEAILASVSIGGLNGCMLMVAPNFISEFCQETIRGTLTSCAIIFYGIGLMFSYTLSGYLEYDTMNYVRLTASVIFLIMLSFVKESPVHLMRKGREEKAAESIAFYRSTEPDSSIVCKELDAIRRTLAQIDGLTPEVQKVNTNNQSQLQFFLKSKSTRLAIGVILTLYSLCILQGLIAIQVYSEPLFIETLPNISANLTSTMFALLNIISGFAAAYTLDYFGRRPVMIYSSFGTCLFCILLGTQIQFHWGPSWLTALFIYGYCITATCGSGTVPYVMIPELFLPEIRGVMTMIATEWGWIFVFGLLYIFNPFVTVVGMGPVFYLFAFTSFISAVFSIIYLPETKGLTVDVIQDVLLKGKPYINSCSQ